MLIGVIGKPSSGKSTYFSAATMVDAEIASRPFTTIKPNRGECYITMFCVHSELGKGCNPQNSKCENGIRMAPLQLLDVAGLIEGSWQGKGLGNLFLNDLMQASALIHVLDVSGTTDAEGNPTKGHNPAEDVRFLEKEIDYWIRQILQKNWGKISKQATANKNAVETIAKQLSGLGMLEEDIKEVLEKKDFSQELTEWDSEEMLRFASAVREKSKPMLIACNKIDLPNAKENFEKLKKEFPEKIFVPCCSEAELALRKAAKAGSIEYVLGSSEFKEKGELPEKQKKALEFIQEKILGEWKSTGVQQALNKTAFELLKLIAVYPVEDAHKLIDSKGHTLPDVHFVKQGATVLQLAEKIHSSFAERFVAAIDCKTGKKIGKDHALNNNDVVKIQLRN